VRQECFRAALLALATLALPAGALEAPFDPAPWIEDLHEIRAAFASKYANFEWAVFEREADLSGLFRQAEDRILRAASEADARDAIERMIRALGDGHVSVVWRAPGGEPRPEARAPVRPAEGGLCALLGYDSAKGGSAVGPHLPGFEPLRDPASREFSAGLLRSGGHQVGMLRIGLFSPAAFPSTCAAALKALAIPADATCDKDCADRVEAAAYAELSRQLAESVRALRRAGAAALVIDLTGNGGGSEWAEAAARVLSPVRLRSERMAFVRGAHWSDRWDALGRALLQAAEKESAQDAAKLRRWAMDVGHARAEAMATCPSDAFWEGQHPDCRWLGRAFYATGVLGEADAAALRKKPWGALVFTPAKYDFEERVWHGPLLVLVDGGTGSAAEEFAAVLQDNRAAAIIGAPTAGAGCGHTDGGTPTKLANSGAVLELPDCVRVRLDGSNEVGGIDPDVLVGLRRNDGLRRRGLRFAAALPAGLVAAGRLCERERCGGE
jgi:hypothetical protein